MKWLEKLPLVPFAVLSVMLALAPFVPEPHLLEKLKMLADGALAKPIDIFDLFLHGTPITLLVVRLINKARNKTETPKN